MIWLVGEANLQGVGLWSALPTPITFLLWKHLGAFGILASPYFNSRRKIRARPVLDLRGQVAGHWGVGRARGGPQRLQQSLLQPRARGGAAEIHPLPLRSLADYTPPLPSRPKLRLRLRLQFATSSAALPSLRRLRWLRLDVLVQGRPPAGLGWAPLTLRWSHESERGSAGAGLPPQPGPGLRGGQLAGR